MASNFGRMEPDMMVTGKLIKLMGKDCSISSMAIYTMENGLPIKHKDMEFIHIQMELSMMVNLLRINKMDKEKKLSLTDQNI